MRGFLLLLWIATLDEKVQFLELHLGQLGQQLCPRRELSYLDLVVAASLYTNSAEIRLYDSHMARTNINIDEGLIRKARKLTHLKTKREVVDRAMELVVRSEDRKSILRYQGSGIWKSDCKAGRRNRV